jgi:maltose alpha-D-glucosyltransferase/alpha-amylase
VFLGSYLRTAGDAAFVPAEHRQLEVVLNTALLNKAVYELRYEANMRPEWIRIPARGILDLLQAGD